MTKTIDTGIRLDRRRALALGVGALAASCGASLGLSTRRSYAAGLANTLTQVRNATLRIDYGGVRFLVDPLLAETGAYPGFPGTANSQLRNPLVPLPMPVERLVDVDAVIVTHLHADHWDEAAKAALSKNLPIFAQDEEDAAQIRGVGFTDVRVLTETTEFRGVRLAKGQGRHGTDEALKALPILGHVCGVVFSHPSAKTLYVAGDTIWNRQVESAILIASHMEAINHCTLSRADLRAFSERENFASRLLIPADGESVRL